MLNLISLTILFKAKDDFNETKENIYILPNNFTFKVISQLRKKKFTALM